MKFCSAVGGSVPGIVCRYKLPEEPVFRRHFNAKVNKGNSETISDGRKDRNDRKRWLVSPCGDLGCAEGFLK